MYTSKCMCICIYIYVYIYINIYIHICICTCSTPHERRQLCWIARHVLGEWREGSSIHGSTSPGMKESQVQKCDVQKSESPEVQKCQFYSKHPKVQVTTTHYVHRGTLWKFGLTCGRWNVSYLGLFDFGL